MEGRIQENNRPDTDTDKQGQLRTLTDLHRADTDRTIQIYSD